MDEEQEESMKKWIVRILLVMFVFLLSGCSGIEPEKRRYPLAMGVDWADGKFQVYYGMPDLPASTGQNKQEEGGNTSILAFSGESFEQIQEIYDQSQDKYLDLGHVSALILGPGIREGGHWEILLKFLREGSMIGEDMYVFEGENVDNLMNLNQPLGTSLGEYLTGIYENRPKGRQSKGVTLKEVYFSWYEERELPELPRLKEENGKLKVEFV